MYNFSKESAATFWILGDSFIGNEMDLSGDNMSETEGVDDMSVRSATNNYTFI